jgi:hypothetical protein
MAKRKVFKKNGVTLIIIYTLIKRREVKVMGQEQLSHLKE